MEEVLIFANENHPACGRVLPDLGVGCLGQSHIEYMEGFFAAGGQKSHQGDRELVIHQELHEA
jgi:hypothetical protein